jgi:RNA recognition motif-containing protein
MARRDRRVDGVAKRYRVLVCWVIGSTLLEQHTDKEKERMINIYVGNLSYNTTEDDLRAAFGEFGDISKVAVITDKYTGQSKGFGFVEMENDDEANAAMQALNETDMGGRTIRVNQAKPRGDRPPRSNNNQRW